MSCDRCSCTLNGIGPEISPKKKILQFIQWAWDEDDQERFLEIGYIDDLKQMPGLEIEDIPNTNRFITNELDHESFIEHQEKILNTLSDKQIDQLCVLMDVLATSKMMDCESMVSFPAQGFWLTNKGKPVIFHAR
jgi:hypothetical protein